MARPFRIWEVGPVPIRIPLERQVPSFVGRERTGLHSIDILTRVVSAQFICHVPTTWPTVVHSGKRTASPFFLRGQNAESAFLGLEVHAISVSHKDLTTDG